MPARLLAALPTGLHGDLFSLLLRQRQYVGAKGAQQVGGAMAPFHVTL